MLKNSTGKKTLIIFAIICAAVLSVLRGALLITEIELGTGFYSAVSSPLQKSFNFLLCGFAAAALAMARALKPIGPEPCAGGTGSRLLAVSFAALGFVATSGSVNSLYGVFSGGDFFRYTYLPGIKIIILAFAAASGVCFIFLGFRLTGGGQKKEISPLLTIVPVIWQTLFLIDSFMSYTAIVSISDQVLDVLFTSSFIAFLLCFGRGGAGVATDSSARLCVFCGSVCFALGCLIAGSHIAARLAGIFPEFAFEGRIFIIFLGGVTSGLGAALCESRK